uniref:Bromodomain-containing protein 8 n=1 Tax=Gouania willdenowi TaxID=441366 RepID=A0A8C5EUV4_GOUWI
MYFSSTCPEHKLLVIGPSEPWSVREKLCLATSVMKSGDQNWVSVSRAIKPFAEPGRPPDWFSQKHCASKYSELLETTEAPKRKRGEKGEVVETVEDVIVRRLTAERIEELKKLIKETQETHRKLKKEAALIQAGHQDSKLEELWKDIQQKKKLDAEEAELKKKNTEAAYQARQVARLAPKRTPSASLPSPSGCGSPNHELTPGDPLEGLAPDFTSPKNVSTGRFTTFTDTSGPAIDVISPGSVLEDPSQKKVLVQKVTPPPSPLLSELLKKGAPMLSRLLEAGPTKFSPSLSFMVNSAPPAPPLPPQPPTITTTTTAAAAAAADINSANTKMDLTMSSGCQTVSVDDKASELSEEDVTVSYMGDELDLKTVGDIIAIIEDKADEAAEALDAAAVEAALSLCEENGHALSGSWVAGPFRPHDSHPTGAPQSLALPGAVEGRTDAPVSSLCNSQDNCPTAFPLVSSSLCNSSKRLEQEEEEEEEDEDEDEEEEDEEEEEDGDGTEGFLSEPDGDVEPAASESEDGYSLHTASSSLRLHATADSMASSPASSQFSVCSEDLEALQAQKIWRKAIMLVWRAAANHRYANVFLQPVTDEIAPGYHSIVHRPMDLATIKKNIEAGLIRTTAEFQRDIMLMFQNAVMYNSLDHDVYHMAVEMQRDVLEQIQQFLATQLIMETSESGISTKSLRGRDGTRRQDSTDKVLQWTRVLE